MSQLGKRLLLEIFDHLIELTKSKAVKKFIPPSSCGFARGCLSRKKIKDIANWMPKYNLSQGLALTVDWFKKNGK